MEQRSAKVRGALSLLLIAMLPFLIILSSTGMLVYNLDFYKALLEKNGVGKENALEATQDLFSYFRDKAEVPNYFSEEEKAHLAEVKKIWRTLHFIFPLMLFLWVILLAFSKEKNKIFLNGGLLTAALLIFLVIVPFSYSFEYFHRILFSSQWRFGMDSTLISVYPESFFYDFASVIWLNSLILALALTLMSIIQKRSYIFNHHKI